MNARSEPGPIVVIGDVMLDVIAAPRGPIETGADTPASITLLPGGSGANVAAWLGHNGCPVSLVGRVGSDSAAWHAAALRELGVTPRLAVDPVARTGVLVNLISSDGERSFLTDRGANDELAREDLPDALLDDAALVHVSAYAFSQPGPRAAVLAFLAVAAAREIPVTVDPGSRSLLRDIGTQAFLTWTDGARICFPNAEEAAALSSRTEPYEQLAELGKYYETVVIKRGRAGAVAATEYGAHHWTAAAPDVRAIDSTGAGDAFVASFLAAYVRGGAVADCLEAGVHAGSATVARYGGRPPIIGREPRARPQKLPGLGTRAT